MASSRAQTTGPSWRYKTKQKQNTTASPDTVETRITAVVLTDETVFTQNVNEASTLGWGTRVKGFIACFVVGAACTILVSRHVCIHFCNDQRGRAQGGLMWSYWFFLPRGMLYGDVNSSGNFHQVALKCHLQSGEDASWTKGLNSLNDACFDVLQGVCVLFLPRIGLTLFIVFYTFGNICALCRSVSTATGTHTLTQLMIESFYCKVHLKLKVFSSRPVGWLNFTLHNDVCAQSVTKRLFSYSVFKVYV